MRKKELEAKVKELKMLEMRISGLAEHLGPRNWEWSVGDGLSTLLLSPTVEQRLSAIFEYFNLEVHTEPSTPARTILRKKAKGAKG